MDFVISSSLFSGIQAIGGNDYGSGHIGYGGGLAVPVGWESLQLLQTTIRRNPATTADNDIWWGMPTDTSS